MDRFWAQLCTLFEATKGEPLVSYIKAVGTAKQATGGERIAVLIIATIDKVLFGLRLVEPTARRDSFSFLGL
jgi:hypothetical protein